MRHLEIYSESNWTVCQDNVTAWIKKLVDRGQRWINFKTKSNMMDIIHDTRWNNRFDFDHIMFTG